MRFAFFASIELCPRVLSTTLATFAVVLASPSSASTGGDLAQQALRSELCATMKAQSDRCVSTLPQDTSRLGVANRALMESLCASFEKQRRSVCDDTTSISVRPLCTDSE